MCHCRRFVERTQNCFPCWYRMRGRWAWKVHAQSNEGSLHKRTLIAHTRSHTRKIVVEMLFLIIFHWKFSCCSFGFKTFIASWKLNCLLSLFFFNCCCGGCCWCWLVLVAMHLLLHHHHHHHRLKIQYKIPIFLHIKSNDFLAAERVNTKKKKKIKRKTTNEDIMNFKNKELSCQDVFSIQK